MVGAQKYKIRVWHFVLKLCSFYFASFFSMRLSFDFSSKEREIDGASYRDVGDLLCSHLYLLKLIWIMLIICKLAPDPTQLVHMLFY